MLTPGKLCANSFDLSIGPDQNMVAFVFVVLQKIIWSTKCTKDTQSSQSKNEVRPI